jgi:hypothetical protein
MAAHPNERFVMRLGTTPVAALSGLILAATVGLAGCSSSSTSSETSASGGGDVAAVASAASAAAAADSAAPSGPDTSGNVLDAKGACAQVDAAKSGYMKNFTATDQDSWNKFADEMLTASSNATDPDLSGALMNVAVAAQFTVSGLGSGDTLQNSLGDFNTTITDLGKICTAQGAPLK